MSEYWKSTPKYWCKFCKVFIKDTPLSRKDHDATPRHQGNIQKSLRGLHKEREFEERQKQRAKDEVARLNGVVRGGSSSSVTTAGQMMRPGAIPDVPKKATFDERKRQMQQLAQMGVAVPEEFRKEMAMAGDWQTLKVTRIEQSKTEDGDSKEAVAFGIRKRKFEDQEEEEAILGIGEAAPSKNRAWGSRRKEFPGSTRGAGEDDLDALLGGVMVKRDVKVEDGEDGKEGEDALVEGEDADGKDETAEQLSLKKSDSEQEQEAIKKLEEVTPEAPVKTEEVSEKATETPGAGIVFKKRKKIAR
jgi:hypothetical protein